MILLRNKEQQRIYVSAFNLWDWELFINLNDFNIVNLKEHLEPQPPCPLIKSRRVGLHKYDMILFSCPGRITQSVLENTLKIACQSVLCYWFV